MIRAVLDANILFSAYIRPYGSPGLVIQALFFRQLFESVQSEETLDEIRRLLNRPSLRARARIGSGDVELVLNDLRANSVMVIPAVIPPVSRDPKDDIYLATAVAGRADFIVTGDADLLILKAYRGVRIVTPKEFLDELSR